MLSTLIVLVYSAEANRQKHPASHPTSLITWEKNWRVIINKQTTNCVESRAVRTFAFNFPFCSFSIRESLHGWKKGKKKISVLDPKSLLHTRIQLHTVSQPANGFINFSSFSDAMHNVGMYVMCDKSQ